LRVRGHEYRTEPDGHEKRRSVPHADLLEEMAIAAPSILGACLALKN
jgi:hypothetical protein